MGFFDQIGKKATEMYQGAKDKTNQLSSEIKLKSKLSDEKDRVDNLYEDIGKIVYKEFLENKEGFSNEVANKCREIVAAKENIDNINKEIMLLKDMIVCSNCGENIQKDSDFCSKCGTAIAKEGKVIDTKSNQE